MRYGQHHEKSESDPQDNHPINQAYGEDQDGESDVSQDEKDQ